LPSFINIGPLILVKRNMSLYEDVKELNVRGTIITPGLGPAPVIVKDYRGLSKDVAEIIRGEKCVKVYGYIFKFAKCDDNT